MKILFVARMLNDVSGGVERMAIAMMNEMCLRGHAVELFSWDEQGAESYYPIDSRVVWHCLNMGNAQIMAGWRLRARRQLAIRRLLRKASPDVIIAFQHGPFLTLSLAAFGLGVPIIAAERNAPQRFDHLRAGSRRNLIFQTFRLADRITVQLDGYIKGYPAYLHDRIVSIPNPVMPAIVHADPAGLGDSTKRLLSVGRLSYQKNQSVLIDAFSTIAERVPDWNLVLVGTGEDETKLKRLVADKGLNNRVELTGSTKDVERYYQGSHLFCLPSRWEGFPNALAEAMAHGLPAVGFADCAGVGQLIEHGSTGVLAAGNGSSATLADALLPLMQDDATRENMGRAAAVAMTKYVPGHIFDCWERLFVEVASKP